MENICHTLLGAALSKAGLEKKTALATPTLLVAANLPDIDIAGTAFGKNYLDFHRGITHAVAGVGVASLGLAAAVWLAERAWFGKPQTRAPFLVHWYIVLAGLATHPFLDYLNDYGIRPWLPFNGRWYYGDLLGIVDPWIWIILGTALYMAARTRVGRVAWAGLGVLLGTLIFWATGMRFGAVWLLVLLIAMGAYRQLRSRGFQTPRIALAVFGLYLAFTAALHWHVLRSAQTLAAEFIHEPIRAIHVLPGRPDSAARWVAVIESESRYYFADAGAFGFGQRGPNFESFEKNLDDPCYRVALSREQIAVMSRFARFPSVSSQASGGSCTVVLRDLRYARRASGGWGTARATVPQKIENP